MMIQIHNERSNAIGLDRHLNELEVVKVESKQGNGINNKGKLKNQMLHIRMIVRNELDKENWFQVKEDV